MFTIIMFDWDSSTMLGTVVLERKCREREILDGALISIAEFWLWIECVGEQNLPPPKCFFGMSVILS